MNFVEFQVNIFQLENRMDICDFIYDLKKTIEKYKDIDQDAFSRGQLKSKKWTVDILEDLNLPLGMTFVLCGWYGILPAMLFYSNLSVDKIRSFDKDENCCEIADSINKTNFQNQWRFKAITEDILKIDFNGHVWQVWSKSNNRMCYPITDVPDTIINTSCEHTSDDWYDKIPVGKFVVLQSNNFIEIKDHVNCVFSLDEMIDQYKMSKIFFSGEKKLEKYSRYMLIGIK